MLLVLTILKLGTWNPRVNAARKISLEYTGWGILWYRRKHVAFEKKPKVKAPSVQHVNRKQDRAESEMVVEDLDGRKINI
jgi:hypothetical protein